VQLSMKIINVLKKIGLCPNPSDSSSKRQLPVVHPWWQCPEYL